MLRIAALGYDKRAFDHQFVQARELGHWTLMRVDRPEVWQWLRENAAPDDATPKPKPAERVAAIALLGQRNHGADRARIEAGLGERDARVRLAAAEALGSMRRKASLERLLGTFDSERHAVVGQAIVDAVHAILRRHRDGLDAARRQAVVETLLDRLGERDWRTQLAIVHVVRSFLVRAAAPALIGVLQRNDARALRRRDDVRTSPILKDSAWQVLCQLTGTRLPADEPAKWVQFWRDEGPKLTLRTGGAKARRTTARATFYGTPVLGRDVAFLIDTSRSMHKRLPDPDDPIGGKRTRLQLAAKQVALAISGLPAGTRYHLWTFAGAVRDWTPNGVRVGRRTQRALTSRLADLVPDGGTDLWQGLSAALKRSGIEEIFIVTDGLPSTGEITEPAKILELVRQANKYQKIRIHAVFSGGGAGAEFLRELCEETGGRLIGW